MAITSSFNQGLLNTFGDAASNTITISRKSNGQLQVNGGAVSVLGGTPTVNNTSTIQVFGMDGDDKLSLDESKGALPSALLFGGAGNDVLTGGSAADQLFGQGDDDTLYGRAGADLLLGGDGNDVLVGGDGNDQMLGEDGDDRMIWNVGDDNDVMEGGTGTDTAEVNGGTGGEVFAITANGDRVRFDRISPDPFFLDIGTTENLVVNANGGNDAISVTGNVAALIALSLDGGAGNDTILGGNGNDTLIGGDGNDFVDGNQGSDTAMLGAGNDTFQWDPGDGSDVVEGGAGSDTMVFNGSAINEIIDISANGERLTLTRNIASIIMDMNDVETIKVATLAGTDTLIVHDLTGTDAKLVNVNLAGTLGGTTGDGAADTVIAQGTSGHDSISVTAAGSQVAVGGLYAQVTIDNADAGDKVVVSALDGDDVIDASGFKGSPASVLLSGDNGDDVLFGSAGGDTLLGGQDEDILFGNAGDDTLNGGTGDDLFFGGAGNDTFAFSSSLDGHDVIGDFDGDAAGGQDLLDFDSFFDSSEVIGVDRSDRVLISDNGSTVDVYLDADGIAANGFELLAVTLNTTDTITLGQDVLVGSLV